MTDNIENATEVASERVAVPSDPGGYVIRSCDAVGWSMEDEEYDSIESASVRINVLRKRHPTIRIFRIIRIPPQGEQVACPTCSEIDRMLQEDCPDACKYSDEETSRQVDEIVLRSSPHHLLECLKEAQEKSPCDKWRNVIASAEQSMPGIDSRLSAVPQGEQAASRDVVEVSREDLATLRRWHMGKRLGKEVDAAIIRVTSQIGGA